MVDREDGLILRGRILRAVAFCVGKCPDPDSPRCSPDFLVIGRRQDDLP